MNKAVTTIIKESVDNNTRKDLCCNLKNDDTDFLIS